MYRPYLAAGPVDFTDYVEIAVNDRRAILCPMIDLYNDLAPTLLVEQDGPVRIVTVNKPEQLNSMSDDLHFAIAETPSGSAAPTASATPGSS